MSTILLQFLAIMKTLPKLKAYNTVPVPFLGHDLHGDPQAFPNEQQQVDFR